MIRICSNLVSCGSEPPRLAHPQQLTSCIHALHSSLQTFEPIKYGGRDSMSLPRLGH